MLGATLHEAGVWILRPAAAPHPESHIADANTTTRTQAPEPTWPGHQVVRHRPTKKTKPNPNPRTLV